MKTKIIFPSSLKSSLYKPGSNADIDHKNKLKQEAKEKTINNTLISLRKSYLANVRPDKKLAFKVEHFKKVIKTQNDTLSSDLISYFIFTDKLLDK